MASGLNWAASTARASVQPRAADQPELQRHSREYFAAWQSAELSGQLAPIPGRDHLSILDELHRPEGALTAAVCRLLDRPTASGSYCIVADS